MTLFVSLLIIGLYFVGRFGLGITDARYGLFVPDIAMYLAVGTVTYSAVVIAVRRHQPSYVLALIGYTLTAATGGILIELTGGSSSPFIALWLLIVVFAGMFGWWVWLVLFIAANTHVAIELIMNGQLGNLELIIKMALIAEAPLLASFVIWHSEGRQQSNGGQKAYSALEQQLSQVANKSEIVINSIDDGVVAIDAKGIIQLINPAAQTLLGWPKQDAIGLDYRSVIKLVNQKGEAVSDDFSPINQVMVSNKSATSSQLDLITKSGKKIIISLMVSPVSDNAQHGGVIAVFRDVTLEKQEERQRGEFISTASHEMRTPVAAIEGYLALAMNPQTATIDDKARAYLQKAYESTQHLGRLFQDLLTVSRAEDGRLAPRPTVIDATAFTREIVEGLLQKAQRKGIGLYFAPGGVQDASKHLQPVFYMYADPGHLREVLNNLVDNAIKYTKQGTVTVDVKGDATNINISISDTGIGVPPEDISHLFQKFYRVDNSDTREIGGTGLGLYICRRLIEANNGHISVESTYGKGSTFTVQMPRMSTDQATDIINKTAADQQTQAV